MSPSQTPVPASPLVKYSSPLRFSPGTALALQVPKKGRSTSRSGKETGGRMTNTAKTYIAAVILTGAAATAFALTHWQSDDVERFAMFLVLFVAAATLKCSVPGVAGTYSPVFFFALLGSTTLSLPEVWMASGLAAMVGTVYKPKYKPSLVKVCFNGANMALAAASAYVFVRRMIPGLEDQPELLCILLGAASFYLVNTGLVSTVVALTEQGSVSAIWKNWCAGSLP